MSLTRLNAVSIQRAVRAAARSDLGRMLWKWLRGPETTEDRLRVGSPWHRGLFDRSERAL